MSEYVDGFPPPAPIPHQNRRYPLGLIVAAAVLVLGLLLALILFLTGSSERPLTVKLALFDPDASCSEGGSGGYDDIGPGMPITVKDQNGKLIGSESLTEKGEFYPMAGCEWTTVITVPDDAEQYAVEGGSRGAVTYSRAKLEENDWTAELSIGN
jgi:hypothetical protein